MNPFDKAEEIEDNGLPVFDVAGAWFQDADYYAEYTEDAPNPEPFVFASKRTHWKLKIDWEREAERFQEDACLDDSEGVDRVFRSLKGKEQLQAAIDSFNALNVGAIYFDEPDWGKKIRVKREEALK